MKRALWLAALLVCAALPAMAVNDWGYTGCATDNVVRSGRYCFDFDSSLSPASTEFYVQGSGALACLKTDVDQEGVSATGASPATAIIRYAPYGDVSAAANAGIQVCAAAGCTLTGSNAVPSAQLACVLLGPGTYRVDFPTLPDGADVGLFTVEGVQ